MSKIDEIWENLFEEIKQVKSHEGESAFLTYKDYKKAMLEFGEAVRQELIKRTEIIFNPDFAQETIKIINKRFTDFNLEEL